MFLDPVKTAAVRTEAHNDEKVQLHHPPLMAISPSRVDAVSA
jgi:hypothetical protein